MVGFCFINQTGEPHLPGGTNVQQKINSHVALVSHKLKRQKQKGNLKHIDSGQYTGRSNGRHSYSAHNTNDTSRQAVVITRCPKNGGYDPFAAFEFSIGARIHELLVFQRAYIYSPLGPVGDESIGKICETTWESVVAALASSCFANAFIASTATMHQQLTGSNVMVDLRQESRGRALQGLRIRLSDKNFEHEIPMCMQVIMFTDLCARDFDAAAVHSRYLASRQLEFWPEGVRHSLLWMEIHRAALTLTRPTLDLDKYPLKQGAWLPIMLHHTTPALDEEALKDLYNFYEKLCVYYELFKQLTRDSIVPIPTQRLRFSTLLLLLEGQLLIFSLDHHDPLLAAAALAATYCLRLMTREECMYGNLYHERIFAAAPLIVKRMEDLLVQSSRTASSSRDRRLLLWILNIGSFIEERTGGRYHHHRLSAILSEGDINDEKCQDILGKFLVLDDDVAENRPKWLFPPLRCFALAGEL